MPVSVSVSARSRNTQVGSWLERGKTVPSRGRREEGANLPFLPRPDLPPACLPRYCTSPQSSSAKKRKKKKGRSREGRERREKPPREREREKQRGREGERVLSCCMRCHSRFTLHGIAGASKKRTRHAREARRGPTSVHLLEEQGRSAQVREKCP